MSHKTTQAPPTAQRTVSEPFAAAVRTFGDSLKVVLQAQEDTVKLWGQAVGQANPTPAVIGDWIPLAQRNIDEYLRLAEASCRRNAELVKKVLPLPDGGDAAGMEQRTREWLEASLEAARASAQELASTNLRVVQAWVELLKQSTVPTTAVGSGGSRA